MTRQNRGSPLTSQLWSWGERAARERREPAMHSMHSIQLFALLLVAVTLAVSEGQLQGERRVRRIELEQQQLQDGGSINGDRGSAAGKWERAGRRAQAAKDQANGEDVADMGGMGKESKMADLRLWFDGKTRDAPDKGEPQPAGEAFLGDLPYVLVIVGAGILVVVVVAVRVLKTHQPRSTSYFSPSYSKDTMRGQQQRR